MNDLLISGFPQNPPNYGVFDDPTSQAELPEIKLPRTVTDRMSYTAYTALWTVLNDDYISNQKWLLGEKFGFDIGTPLTVRIMTVPNPTRSRGVWYRVQNRVKASEIEEFIHLSIVGYLLRTDFRRQLPDLPPDMHGKEPLEGELKRFYARLQGEEIRKIKITPDLVDHYCGCHNLLAPDLHLPQRFRARLGFKSSFDPETASIFP